MNTRILTALSVMFCAATARADLEITPAVVNLGAIRGGQPLEVSFSLHNGGQEQIEILEVNRGCDCLTPRLDKRLLAPGESAKLYLSLRTLGHANGEHAWTASIRYREGGAVRELPLGVRAMVVNEVAVQPAVCALFVEGTLSQEITITDQRKPPLAVTRAEATSPAIKVQTKGVAGGVTKIILEASGAGLAPGRYDEMLNIYTDDSSYGHLQVPVTLVRAAKSRVLATPEQVQLLTDADQPLPATIIRLRPRGDQAVIVDKVVANDPAVACTWAAGPGNQATLRVQVNSARPLNSAVHVYLRQPIPETLTIPVQVKLR